MPISEESACSTAERLKTSFGAQSSLSFVLLISKSVKCGFASLLGFACVFPETYR